MNYLPPFAVMGTHNLSDEKLENYKLNYGKLIDLLKSDVLLNNLEQTSFINDYPQLKNE